MADFNDFTPSTGPTPQGGNDFETFGKTPKGAPLSVGSVAKGVGMEAISLGDLALSIPAALLGVGADAGVRFRREYLDHYPRREAAEAGRRANTTMMETFGSPLHKLMLLAGMGQEEGQPASATDAVMQRAGKLLEKGGEWVEKNTDGMLLKEDVQSLADTAMAAGGGRGLASGLNKITPAALRFEGVKLSPYALERMRQQKMQEADPPQAQAEAATRADEAVVATNAKTRLKPAKDLQFDPIKGTLEERIPEMGKELPKPTTLDRALGKAAEGKGFDMTAEERIALKGWKDKPLGQPIVDEQGVPLNRKQGGGVDPKLLARMSAVGLGAWAGQHFGSDHDLLDVVIGGTGGALLSSISPAKAAATLKAFRAPDNRIKINDFADAHEKFTRLAAIDVWGLQKQIEELVPEKARREAITHALEKGDTAELNDREQQAAGLARKYFDETGEVASLEGVLKSARDNYVTHVWDWTANDKSLVQRWLDKGGGTAGMSPASRFAKERSIPTLAEGKAQGLKPLTEDVSHILGIYGNSMNRAIANSVFLRALKQETIPGAEAKLVQPTADAPHSYVSLNHPQFAGLRVHPDIAPSLKMMFDTSSPGVAMKVAQGVSDTAKRIAVSFSLFHAKALTDALIGGGGKSLLPNIKGVGDIPSFVSGTNAYLQELRKGSASPLVQRATEGGLQFSLEHTGAGVEDAGAGFYGTMQSLQGFMDKTIPGAGLPVKGLIELNHKVDTLMWARLHAGMKLSVFSEKVNQLRENSANEAAKGRGRALSEAEASRIAASYTNDLFGGLNWRRVAEDAQTRWGRELGQATVNPGARRVLQLAMFAPDWTVSTTRAALQAFGEGSGLRGLITPTKLADLHRQYLLRSGMYYLVVGDAINYSMSGHHVWQNKDPTVLDLDPEGYKHMQWSKHTMEPVHWLTKPAQQGINKLGFIPREATEQALNVEYLSAKGRMPPMEDRVRHLAKNFSPIAVQQGAQSDSFQALAGFAGVPVYGATPAERRAAREARRRKKEQSK